MPYYDLESFLQSVKYLEYDDIVAATNLECAKLEKSGGKQKKADALMLAGKLRAFLYWMQTKKRPKDLPAIDFMKFEPLGEALVAKEQLSPKALEIFKTAAT